MHLDIKGESVEKYMMLAELEVLSSISSCMDVVPTTHSLQSFTVSAICLLSRVFFGGEGECVYTSDHHDLEPLCSLF